MDKFTSRKISREMVMHLSYGFSYSNQSAEKYFNDNVNEENFLTLSEDYEIYNQFPNDSQYMYMKEIFLGAAEHAAELDEFISKYAKGWKFDRISLVANAIMRVAMYEILYYDEVPNGVAINEAVEICKKYEDEDTAKFVNGILGNFLRCEVK